ASARYLMHLRNAWNHAMTAEGATNPQQLFENQEIVLTVPASFDEEARELTVEAAREAGLQNLTLLEEPLAAFYAWVAEHQNVLGEHLRNGELVLICDIGGGTSDFSLVLAHVQGRKVEFQRTAIGEHLLLGGENLDLALARRVEHKLTTKLSLRQRHSLRIICSAAKERLLSEENTDRLQINILGGGRAVVGQMLSSELCHDEVAEWITEAIANWFGAGGGWRPKILSNEVMSSAVAIGAAYYGRVRRGAGLRVKAGSASTYYIGMRSEHGIKAVCVLPSGTNEGTTLPLLDRKFSVLTNRPVSFH